jgi:acetaldehyde dehydrogenase / alcohol dehydrogenase
MIAIIEEILASDTRQTESAELILQAAEWSQAAFAQFDRHAVKSIAMAAADAGYAKAGQLAEAAVRETGMGVAVDKKIKNEMASRGIYQRYREHDYCSRRVRANELIVEAPRPAGVILALTPASNPVCTIFSNIMLALMTRNAIVILPERAAKSCSIEAARTMAMAATRAGAPAGAIQIIEELNPRMIESVASSPRINLILATGVAPAAHTARSAGIPTVASRPANIPVLVDAGADIEAAAKQIVQSKSFDNSLLSTNESAVVAEEAIADRLLTALGSFGAYIAKNEEIDLLRGYLFGEGSFSPAAKGRSAGEIARHAGFRIPPTAKIIVAALERIGVDEPLSSEKPCPVLGFIRVPHVSRGIAASRALAQLAGAGHSAAIHSRAPETIMAYAASLSALRVIVNAPCSQGAAGFVTHLAPSFTIGTGFAGGSSVGENLEPGHLVNWKRIAYDGAAMESFSEFGRIEPRTPGPNLAMGRETPISFGRLQAGVAALSRDGTTIPGGT